LLPAAEVQYAGKLAEVAHEDTTKSSHEAEDRVATTATLCCEQPVKDLIKGIRMLSRCV